METEAMYTDVCSPLFPRCLHGFHHWKGLKYIAWMSNLDLFASLRSLSQIKNVQSTHLFAERRERESPFLTRGYHCPHWLEPALAGYWGAHSLQGTVGLSLRYVPITWCPVPYGESVFKPLLAYRKPRTYCHCPLGRILGKGKWAAGTTET